MPLLIHVTCSYYSNAQPITIPAATLHRITVVRQGALDVACSDDGLVGIGSVSSTGSEGEAEGAI